MKENVKKPYKMYACLPYLSLQSKKPIGMGPIRFYPSAVSDDFIGHSEQEEMKAYFHLKPEINHGTCICVHPGINEDEIPELLVDALYLLYFAATYQPLYHNDRPPQFDAMTKFVPAIKRETSNPESINLLKALNVNQSQIVSVTISDYLMSDALGQLLSRSYLPAERQSPGEDPNQSRRIIRSIRYFLHCFYEKFENLLGSGVRFKEKIYEPEDFLFLVTAFETLFDLDPNHPGADLKQKLRPVLHVKFGPPLETIWKWIDGFFEIKTAINTPGDTAGRDIQS